jgi:hypothetical protein
MRLRLLHHLAAAVLLANLAAGAITAQDESTLDDPAAWVTKRVRDWQPAPAERRFDDIGWAKDILEARRLAKEHHRPVFLFTHDGHMAVGRC